MSGPEILANAIHTVLRDLPLREPAGALRLALIAVLSLLPVLAGLRWSRGGVLLVAAVAGGLYAVAAQLAFKAGLVLPVFYALGGLLFASLAVLTGELAAVRLGPTSRGGV